jgi:hypothetical protein
METTTCRKNPKKMHCLQLAVWHNDGRSPLERQCELGSYCQAATLVKPPLRQYAGGICYTFDNYKEVIARDRGSAVSKLSVNGIFPDKNTVKNRTFPFISEVHSAPVLPIIRWLTNCTGGCKPGTLIQY